MENQGDEWHRATAERIGQAIAARRKALGLTAQQLAERCRELKAPIHRTTITKIENGRPRFDLGELLVLAAALNIPPSLLLYPGFPDDNVQVLPGHEAPSREAVKWLAGVQVLPAKVDADGKVEVVLPYGTRGPGIDLVDAVKEQQGVETEMLFREINSRVEGAPKAVVDAQLNILRILETRLASLPAEIEQAKVSLWGKPKGDTIA